MLTQKTRYAIFALVKLARDYDKGPIQINQIAESEKIPKRFLEVHSAGVEKQWLSRQQTGKNGGYFLNKKPEQINLLEIVRLFEGSNCIAALYFRKILQTLRSMC
jgi:Rrf2 family protein